MARVRAVKHRHAAEISVQWCGNRCAMNISTFVAILVPVLVATITAIAGVYTLRLTKQKELEATWRTHKLQHYRTLLDAMNGVVGKDPPMEGRVRFAQAANNVGLVASPEVLAALQALLDQVAAPTIPGDGNRQQELLTALIYAIRDDIGIDRGHGEKAFRFRLWGPGPGL